MFDAQSRILRLSFVPKGIRLAFLSRVRCLETFRDGVYVIGESKSEVPRPVIFRTTDITSYGSCGFDVDDMSDYECFWRGETHSVLKNFNLPTHLVAAEDASVYKLSGGRRRRRRHRRRKEPNGVSIQKAFNSAFWPFTKYLFAEGVLAYGQSNFAELLTLSLLRVNTEYGEAITRDLDGNIFHLDNKNHLRLYGKDRRDFYDFGRLPIEGGLKRKRMHLDECRRLLFIWYRCGGLKVFSFGMKM